MVSFDVAVEVRASAPRAWAALVDWPSHGQWMPLTSMRMTSARPDGVGAAFVARTGIGPLAFDDPMVVTEWRPPADGAAGRCALRKTGRVVLGSATFAVEPRGQDRCRVRWHEEVDIAPTRLTRPLAPLLRLGGWLSFRLALARFGRHLRSRPAQPGSAPPATSGGPA